MSSRRRPPTLQEAQRADVEQGWGQAEEELLTWDTRLAHKAKRWTRLAAAVTGLAAACGTAVVTVKGYAVKLWHVVTRGAPAAAELPATGEPTISTDRVPQPPPPKP
jgi:hypothetical protein